MRCRIALVVALTAITATAFAAGTSPIADAAMRHDLARVRALIGTADVNAPQADGATALHWAAQWDDVAMARALLKAGASPGVATREGATPMFLAAENGSAAMIALLIEAGADANAPVLSHGETALMVAARTGRIDAVRTLLDHGAAVDAAETLRGTSALDWAADQGHADVVSLLVSSGADVNRHSSVVSPVSRAGLTFARADRDGNRPREHMGSLTPLLFAARQGALAVVTSLVAAGATIDDASADGSSPLLVAVQNGNYDAATFLLERGANPNQENVKGWTPLYLAVANRNALTTAVPPPAKNGVLDFIQAALNHGADVNHRIKVKTEVHAGNTSLWLDEAGATPLLRAALCGDLTVVRLLLDHGADPLLSTVDHTTPLMTAAGVGWAEGFTFEYSPEQTLDLVKLLLDKGAKVNDANDHGITPLHGAAYKGANAVVQLLVDRGADLAALDKGEDYGFGASSVRMTPLNWAEGVPIGMSSAIAHDDTVALLATMMAARGIPVVRHSFHGQKKDDYEFVTPPANVNGVTPPPSAERKP
jgi:ankyrin repeat protein